MQIEIDEAVGQQCAASGKCPEVKCEADSIIRLREAPPRLPEEKRQKAGAYQPADYTCFREEFNIVIVRVIDDRAVIESFVPRKDRFQRSEAGAGHGMVQENSP